MENSIITLENLTKDYANLKALDNLTLNIEKGSILGLIGRNGSGKSTLMKILAGKLDNTGGEVKIFGENPMDNLKVLNKTIYSYHNYVYSGSMNLQTIMDCYSIMFDKFDKQFAIGLLKYFELKGKMKYKSLSQGMSAIFNFSMALASRCELTMFDEPTLGMDVTVRKSAYDVLLREFAQNPRTFIISSHLINELEPVLSNVLLLEKGKKIVYDDVDTLRNSAFRVDGDNSCILDFIKGKKAIEVVNSPLQSFAIVEEKVTEQILNETKAKNLQVSNVNLEDLFVYLTKDNKEGELECLW